MLNENMNLLNNLLAFAASANANEQARRITQAWNTTLCLQCTDTEQQYQITVSDGLIEDVAHQGTCTDEDYSDDSSAMLLRSEEACFSEIFTGKRNPSLASLEGDLEVYGNEKHGVKLDAITLILWGF